MDDAHPTSKPPLSVSFHNFWGEFRPATSFFVRALRQSLDVSVVDVGRDLQISSVFGRETLPPNKAGTRPLRVWWTGEARDPQFQFHDLYFGFRRRTGALGNRWHRFPLWVIDIDWWNPASAHYVGRLKGPRSFQARPRFCNFIYSKPASIRAEFFLRLDEARHVDSLGRVFNNNGGGAPSGREGKMRALADYTFTIAFENQLSPGYVTEKLLEPLLANSIPIYWGAPEARTDFNPEAFIFAEDFDGFDDLAAHVVRLADSRDALAALAGASPLPAGGIAYEHTPDFFVDRITEALSGAAAPLLPDRYVSINVPQHEKLGRRLERKVRRMRNKALGLLGRD